MTIRKIMSITAGKASSLCNWRIRADYKDARDVLSLCSPKPYGSCYTRTQSNITHDLQVVIPAYNVEQYIDKCLCSVNQLFNSKYKVLVAKYELLIIEYWLRNS